MLTNVFSSSPLLAVGQAFATLASKLSRADMVTSGPVRLPTNRCTAGHMLSSSGLTLKHHVEMEATQYQGSLGHVSTYQPGTVTWTQVGCGVSEKITFVC